MIVYKIINLINSKLYFGITKCSLKKRWKEHKSKSKYAQNHLYLAIRKYGLENFNIEVVKECDSEHEMYELEIKLIQKHKTNNRLFGYNNSTGGEKSSLGQKLSDQAKKSISEFQKNRKRTNHTEDAKIKMRESAKGRKMWNAIYASVLSRIGKPSKNRVKISCEINGVTFLFNSIKEASLETSISITSINNCLKGRSKTSGGYKWEYQQKN